MDGYANSNLILGVGKVVLIDDTGTVQKGQVRLSVSEVRDGMAIPNQFGFQSSAPKDSEVVYAAFDSERSKAVVLATNHQPSRIKGLGSGGSRQYDAGGRQILMNMDGLIQAFAPGEVLHQVVTDVFMSLFNAHTHEVESVGAPTSVPVQQMTAAHLTTAFRAGT